MKSWIGMIAVVLFSASAARAQAAEPALEVAPVASGAREEVERELERLSKSYQAGVQAWQAARNQLAETQEKRANPPPHPAIAAWPRFEALAQQNCGRALLWLASHVAHAFPARSAEENRREALHLHARIVDEHANDPHVRDWVRRLSGLYIELAEPDVDALVERFVAHSADKEALAEALFRAAAQARRSTRAGAAARAQAWTERLVSDFGGTEYGRRARGEEKSEVGLSVGKLAPDFTTTDADGKSFRLSDYRGKVVVLDFWGFW